MAVVCQKCGRESVVDDTVPRLRNQRLAGRRFRCGLCGGIGLPSLGTRRLAKRLAERDGDR